MAKVGKAWKYLATGSQGWWKVGCGKYEAKVGAAAGYGSHHRHQLRRRRCRHFYPRRTGLLGRPPKECVAAIKEQHRACTTVQLDKMEGTR